jgi:hypothetical protein
MGKPHSFSLFFFSFFFLISIFKTSKNCLLLLGDIGKISTLKQRIKKKKKKKKKKTFYGYWWTRPAIPLGDLGDRLRLQEK